MELMRVVRADWLMTKRSGYRWLIFSAPPLAAAVLLWYYSGRTVTSELSYSIYDTFFQLIATALPLVISLLSGLLAQQEEQAGRFGGLLGRRQPRYVSYAGKLLMVAGPVIVGIYIAAILLAGGMQVVLGLESVPFAMFLTGASYAVIGALTLCALQLLLAFAFGMGASVAAGGAGFLLGAIIGTTMIGDRFWMYIPWSWPARLSLSPLLKRQAEEHGLQEMAYLLQTQNVLAFTLAILSFILVFLYGTIWFGRWEGRKTYE
ncbi:lantibiotic immunity ABC transporter MutG family permease subunit [Paenibacillus sp. CN-4]|uniref:lantibiotic immunity ABC transporter MutG family permease subunit n=1 Tax=Paenibacillus nanchangensis TaxID=3348343 RepID=UPI00397954E6